MNKLLAVECATDSCSVALADDGEIVQLVSREPRANARVLLPMVEKLLQERSLQFSELEALSVSVGPGSFTGIRIGISVVQGLAYGGQLPVYTWNTLELMAAGWFLEQNNQDHTLVAALDARMGEVYWASYRWNRNLRQPEEVQAPSISSLDDFKRERVNRWQAENCVGVGSGFQLIDELPEGDFSTETRIQAKTMLQLIPLYGEARQPLSSAAELAPLYLRNEISWKKRERIRQ